MYSLLPLDSVKLALPPSYSIYAKISKTYLKELRVTGLLTYTDK